MVYWIWNIFDGRMPGKPYWDIAKFARLTAVCPPSAASCCQLPAELPIRQRHAQPTSRQPDSQTARQPHVAVRLAAKIACFTTTMHQHEIGQKSSSTRTCHCWIHLGAVVALHGKDELLALTGLIIMGNVTKPLRHRQAESDLGR